MVLLAVLRLVAASALALTMMVVFALPAAQSAVVRALRFRQLKQSPVLVRPSIKS
jgi:hypothetical protein